MKLLPGSIGITQHRRLNRFAKARRTDDGR